MTGLAFILIASGRKVSLNQRKSLRLVFGGGRLGNIDLEAKNILLYSLVIQLMGAVLLGVYFILNGINFTQSSWHGLFHAVSAFQNAGFDITPGNSISAYRFDNFIVSVITALSLLGATGFNVLFAVIIIRKWRPMNLDLKLVILGSFLRDHTLVLLACLLAIGGVAGSMTGGIKIGVFMIMIFTLWSTLRGRVRTVAFRKEIPDAQVRRAFSIVALAFIYVNLSSLFLSLIEDAPFVEILFEIVSAFGLVGLSTGITSELSALGKLVLIISMFVGRLLPIYIALELAYRERKPLYRFPQEEVRIG
jgi:trk system potassium uptake protein TrkH